MSQFEEDEMWHFSNPDLDFDEEPSDWGPMYPSRGVKPRRIEVDLPGSTELQDLDVGETFRFANAVNMANVYMVIPSEEPDEVSYVLLNSGKVYHSRPTKRVMQIDVRVSIDVKRKRGRV